MTVAMLAANAINWNSFASLFVSVGSYGVVTYPSRKDIRHIIMLLIILKTPLRLHTSTPSQLLNT